MLAYQYTCHMGQDQTDEDLMILYKNGEASAFEILYSRHKGPLYRYVLRQCHMESIAEELFQDIWIKVINARERYEVKAKFTTYLYRVAQNRVIDYFRQSASQNQGDSETEIESIPARYQDQPDARSDLQQRAINLLKSVENLPKEQRQVFLLKEEAGMSLQEIAETTGVNTETVKSRLRYAVKKLRQSLSENHE
jgi:RNA polymerase sigma-70 factor (ECF subfamily)